MVRGTDEAFTSLDVWAMNLLPRSLFNDFHFTSFLGCPDKNDLILTKVRDANKPNMLSLEWL